MRRGILRAISITSPVSIVLEDLQERRHILVQAFVYVLLDSWECLSPSRN